MFYGTQRAMTIGKRIADKRKGAGLSQTALAARIGVGQTAVSNWEKDIRQPDDQHILKLAKIFGCTANWLRYNVSDKTEKKLARLRGYVGAGDVIHMLAEDVTDFVEAPEDSESSFEAFQIRGNSQHPVYRDGDLVYFDPAANSRILDLIGRDCVVEMDAGQRVLKRIEYGSTAGLYTLASYNSPEIRDQAVKSAAEIVWLKRARR